MPKDLYYRATTSGTKDYPESPDQEEVPLSDYRLSETASIHEFIAGDGDVLAVGGMGSAGKTHALRDLHKRYPYGFFDAQGNLGSGNPSFRDQWDEKFFPRAIAHITGKAIGNALRDDGPITAPKCIMIDESAVLYNPRAKDKMPAIVEALLEIHGKVVLVGGGNHHTADEQIELIIDNLPTGLSVSTLAFRNKPLSVRQAAELIELERRHSGQSITEEAARQAAGIYIDYFRIARRVWRTANIIIRGNKRALLENVREDLMPDECYERAIKLQAESFDAKA